MNVSQIKLFLLTFFCGRGKAVDYLFDIANSAIQHFISGNETKYEAAYRALAKVAKLLDCLDWAVPGAWLDDYRRVLDCLENTLEAFEDGVLTKAEALQLATAFRLAYANWRSAE